MTEHPNVLVVVIDDAGMDVLPWSGVATDPANMPLLHEIALESRILNVWSQPSCSPSRMSYLTGLAPRYHLIGEAYKGGENYRPSRPTFFRTAKTWGYFTAAVGKWHLSDPDVEIEPPMIEDLDDYSLTLGNVDDYYQFRFCQNGTFHTASLYSTEWLSNELSVVTATKEPWIATCNYHASHDPFHVPPAGTYTSETDSERGKFKAALESLDHFLGEVWLTGFTQTERDNTVLLVISDNGSPGSVYFGDPGTGKGSTGEGGCRQSVIYRAAPNFPWTALPSNSSQWVRSIQDVWSTVNHLVSGQNCPHSFLSGSLEIGRVVICERFDPIGAEAPLRTEWRMAGLLQPSPLPEAYKLRRKVLPNGNYSDQWYKVDSQSLHEDPRDAAVIPPWVKGRIEDALEDY